MENQKKVIIYHYEEALGKFMAECLNLEGFSAAYMPVNRQMKPGAIVEQITTKSPNLVYLALNFGPGIETDRGWSRFNEGLHELVEIRKRSDVPIVMMTGGGTIHKEEALEKGANKYLSGTLTIEQIVKVAQELTSQSQS